MIPQNFAVIGAGIMGLSTAKSLAIRGHQVTIYDSFPIHHTRGSSHGLSRIVRRAYPNAFYTGIMSEAYPRWALLEEQAGEQLVNEVGLLYFGHRESAEVRSMVDSLAEVGVLYHVLAGDALEAMMPWMRFQAHEVGVFTPEAGWVAADRAIRATADLALNHGAQFKQETVDPFEMTQSYDAVLASLGPWAGITFDLPVRVTKQTVAYLDKEVDGPVWIEDGGSFLYGFPSTDRGLKVGVHQPGVPIDPDEQDRAPDPEELKQIGQFSRRRYGHELAIRSTHACLYTRTANEDFIWGRFAPNGFFASPCSGHGFKFGPWIGERMADFALGILAPESVPRFCLPKSPVDSAL